MRPNMIAVAGLLVGVSGLAGGWAEAATTLKPTPATGHPTVSIAVAGAGFGANEAVDVYFDTTDTELVVSSPTGALTGSVTIPASALPGAHSITAIGRHSGDAAQGSVNVSTPWTLEGYGLAHLGWNPYENVLSPSNVSALGTAWNVSLPSEGSTPLVANGRVYLGTTSGFVALSASTGATIWKANTNELYLGAGAIAGNTLYVASSFGNVYALNAATGATIWKATFNAKIYSSVVVHGGIVYIGDYSKGILYALNASTGAVLWKYTTGGGIDGSPALANGNVYFGSTDDYVYALNATTGALVWKYQTGAAIESSPAISTGVLFIGSDDDKVYALGTSPSTAGALIWSYTAGGIILSNPAVVDGVVYVGSFDGNLYALKAQNGLKVWAYPTDGAVRSPAVANGVIYFTSVDDNFYALSTTGAVLATAPIGSTVYGSPAISDGKVFVPTINGGIYALAVNAGADVVHPVPKPAALRPDLGLAVKR